MRAYLRNHGRHFNVKLCDWATRRMRRMNNSTGIIEPIKSYSKDEVEKILKTNGVTINNINGYDHVYIANMCKVDFLGSSIADEYHLALYIKDVIDDPDAPPGHIFNRFIADCDSRGMSIDWMDLL